MTVSKTTTSVVAQPKWIGKSTSVWGALIALAAVAYQTVGPLADAVGVTVPVTGEDIQEASKVGSNIITALGGAVGFGLTLWGRWKAGKNPQPVTFAPNAAPMIVNVAKPPHGDSKISG